MKIIFHQNNKPFNACDHCIDKHPITCTNCFTNIPPISDNILHIINNPNITTPNVIEPDHEHINQLNKLPKPPQP